MLQCYCSFLFIGREKKREMLAWTTCARPCLLVEWVEQRINLGLVAYTSSSTWMGKVIHCPLQDEKTKQDCYSQSGGVHDCLVTATVAGTPGEQFCLFLLKCCPRELSFRNNLQNCFDRKKCVLVSVIVIECKAVHLRFQQKRLTYIILSILYNFRM